MSDAILARRYARALFELAALEGKEEKVGEEMGVIAAAMEQNGEWARLLDDTAVGFKKKEQMIEKLVQEIAFDKYIKNTLLILSKKRRIRIFYDIVHFYMEKLASLKNSVEATVTVTDEAVWEKLEDEINSVVTMITGKRATLICKIDPSIIGGIVIKIRDKLYDGSVKGEIAAIRKKIFEGAGRVV